MKKIVFSLLILASCTFKNQVKYTTQKTELFECKSLYMPQKLIIQENDLTDKEFANIVEANTKILLDRIEQLKNVINCQHEQLDLIRK